MHFVPSRRWVLVVLTTSVTLWAPAASAQETQEQPAGVEVTAGRSDDVVYLRCGDAVRGRLREVVPKDHVTIVATTGEARRIPWSEVDRVVVGSEDLAPPAPTPAASPTPPQLLPPPPRTAGSLVRVHIASSDAVILYRRHPSTLEWTQVCTPPCDADVPLADEYQIAGVPGSRGPSQVFHLRGAPGGAVVLTVSPPSSVGTGFGIGMVVLGGVSLYTLGLAAMAGAAQTPCPGSDTQSCGANVVYLAALAGAVAVTTLGAILWHTSAKTDIDLGDGGRSNDDTPSPSLYRWRGTQERSPRADVWRALPPEVAAAPPPLTLPILSGSF